MRFVSVDEMRAMDKFAIDEYQINSYDLMERAGKGVATVIGEFINSYNIQQCRRAVIFAGKNNNGGDAYVVARHLAHLIADIEIVIYCIGAIDDLKGDCYTNAQIIAKDFNEIIINEIKDVNAINLCNGDVIIDGLLGTGVHGSLREPYLSLVHLINQQNLLTIAIDLPTGMNGDNGLPCGYQFIDVDFENITRLPIVNADLTVTIGAPKWGMISHVGAEYCGQIRFVDIGLEYFDNATENEMIFASDLVNYFQRRSVYNHKNSVGKVLTIAGSKHYQGAAFLGAIASLKSGAGFVDLAVPKSANIVNNSNVHSVIVHQIKDNGCGTFSKESIAHLAPIIEKVNAVNVGSGISTNLDNIAVLEYLRDKVENKAIIYDADALNLIAKDISLLAIENNKNINILTPHVGEMNRLLKAFNLSEHLEQSRITQANILAKKTQAIVVLKGHHTITALPSGTFFINSSGNIALATAGTGDCLAGIITSFLAKEISNDFTRVQDYKNYLRAVANAVFVHGYCADIYPFAKSGFIADDLLDLLPVALREISPFA
ncbi:NAD(P)H-hydrate dehydratase [Lentisphaerota bacterium WC36G]|nr:NAD(P)H-hydrate dehydratase [Lentisphaerae bacterium WC36]